MELEWDPEKARRNFEAHGVSFQMANQFDWSGAEHFIDDRFEYGEERFIALGLMGGRLHTLVYTQRGDRLRIISLRKSNKRELKRYGRAID
jgi:uncharacterized DUF497 family protein